MDYERAKWLALYYLGIKMRTEQELRKKLREKGADDALCDQTMEFLREYHYIDDVEYARCYMTDSCNLKKHGIRRILSDLRRKGIDENTLQDVMMDVELDFESNLTALIETRAVNLDLSDPKQKNRLVGFLSRRGYNLNDIFTGIREYMEDRNG